MAAFCTFLSYSLQLAGVAFCAFNPAQLAVIKQHRRSPGFVNVMCLYLLLTAKTSVEALETFLAL